MKYELNILLRVCKQKKGEKIKHAHAYKKTEKIDRRGCTRDNLHKRKCTGCLFIYTH